MIFLYDQSCVKAWPFILLLSAARHFKNIDKGYTGQDKYPTEKYRQANRFSEEDGSHSNPDQWAQVHEYSHL